MDQNKRIFVQDNVWESNNDDIVDYSLPTVFPTHLDSLISSNIPISHNPDNLKVLVNNDTNLIVDLI